MHIEPKSSSCVIDTEVLVNFCLLQPTPNLRYAYRTNDVQQQDQQFVIDIVSLVLPIEHDSYIKSLLVFCNAYRAYYILKKESMAQTKTPPK